MYIGGGVYDMMNPGESRRECTTYSTADRLKQGALLPAERLQYLMFFISISIRHPSSLFGSIMSTLEIASVMAEMLRKYVGCEVLLLH
jgi:hypothetical protein